MDKQYKNKNTFKKLEKLSNFEYIPEQIETKENKHYENIRPDESDKKQAEKIKTNNLKSDQSPNNQSNNLTTDLVLEKSVENILAAGLDDLYQSLDPTKKIIFKQKGEETALSIVVLLKSVKFKIYEILDLIRNWLFIIPGINKFFLEQEAKIKTDKILQIDLKNKK